jgi:hypothetical protein
MNKITDVNRMPSPLNFVENGTLSNKSTFLKNYNEITRAINERKIQLSRNK